MRYRMQATVLAVVATSMLGVAPVQANPIWCTGTISALWVDSSGTVLVLPSWRQDHTAMCSLTGTWHGIPAEVCRSWYALMLTARAAGQRLITMYYFNGSCAGLPIYGNAPAPYYVMLLD